MPECLTITRLVDDIHGLLGRGGQGEVYRASDPKLGREVNPRIYRLDEFAKRIAARDHFVLSVLSKPKLFVIGSKHELDDLTARESRDRRAVRQG